MVAGSLYYIRDTIAGKTKPNLVSWSMWALAPLIGVAAAWASDADVWATVRIFLAGFLPLLVVLVALFNRQSYWKLTVFDLLCGVFSSIALIFWVLADSPRTAILLAAIGDGFAALPTVIKVWRFPQTETRVTYLASAVSALLVVPSIPVWNIENAAFTIYLIVNNTLLLLLLYRHKLGLGRAA
jgi:hypothetical protein